MSYSSMVVSALKSGDTDTLLNLEFEETETYSKIITPQQFEESVLRENGICWHRELLALYHEGVAQGIVKDLIVHGSYGDFTQTNFSDIELTVLVSGECFTNSFQSKLLKKWIESRLNPLFIHVDPLQHHSCFFLWDESISPYEESYLPITAYEDCWSVCGEPIKLQVREDIEFTHKSWQRLNATLANLADCSNVYFRYGVNLYSIKRVLSNFFMIPVYFYQAQGLMLNKKNALKKIKNRPISGNFEMALRIASHIRNDWPRQKQWKSYLRKSFVKSNIPQGRLDLTICNLFRDSLIRTQFEKEFYPVMQLALKDLEQSIYENIQ